MRPIKDGASSTICDGGYGRNYGIPIHRKRHSLRGRKSNNQDAFTNATTTTAQSEGQKGVRAAYRVQEGHYPNFWEVHVSCRDGLMECTGRCYDSRAVSLHGLVREHAWIRHGPVDHVAPHSAVTPVHFICQHRDTALSTTTLDARCPASAFAHPAALGPPPALELRSTEDEEYQKWHLSLEQLPATRALPLQLSSISTAKLQFGLTLPPPKTSDPPKTSIPRAFGAVERVCTL